MQLAIFEARYVDDVPMGVAISEAVRLAKKYDSRETGSFVNGILGSFARSLTASASEEIVSAETLPVEEPAVEVVPAEEA